MADIVNSVSLTLERMGLHKIPGNQVAGFVGEGVQKLIQRALRWAIGTEATEQEIRTGIAFFLAQAAAPHLRAARGAIVNIGGLLCLNDEEIFVQVKNELILREGFPTYGGLAGRDLDAIATGLYEGLDEDYLAYRLAQTAYLVERINDTGIPTIQPAGGHAVYVDAQAVFPHIPGLTGLAHGGTNFVLVYPSTMWGCAQDCMWWLELRPQGPHRTILIHGACFPRTTVARGDFEEVVQRYFKRWDSTAQEDIAASERQHRGLRAPFNIRGRFSHHEVLVHEIDNWVLDRVLGPAG